MKIDRPSDVSTPLPPSGVDALAARPDRATPGVTGVAGNGPSAPPGGSSSIPVAADSVELSEATRALNAASGTGDDIRADKVAALKLQIEAGKFPVDVHKVAEKMISEAAELLEAIAITPK